MRTDLIPLSEYPSYSIEEMLKISEGSYSYMEFRRSIRDYSSEWLIESDHLLKLECWRLNQVPIFQSAQIQQPTHCHMLNL